MSEFSQIAETLPYYNKKILLKNEHTTGDIIAAIRGHHKKYLHEYDTFANKFWAGNAHDTAKRLFAICRRNIRYDVEHPDNQSVKSPGAIFAQKHGDCKHYASLINGVCDSLHRQGYPIDCYYRFVADSPNEEVHHVFAVVTDGKREYWTDPVLSAFNSQPIFHNIKDVSMGQLYSISGTENGRPTGLALVGKKKKNNIFRKIGKELKKVEHGAEVNLHNAGKEVKKAADKVKNVVLKVSMAPARNAFLALIDLNAFNLATRLGDAWAGTHGAAIRQKWVDIGGDPNKLKNAINNGRKHKAYYHHTAVKKITGAMGVHLMHLPHEQHNRRRHPGNMQYNRLIHAYHIGEDDYGRLPVVSGIGEPISIGALTAMASALIAVFSKWLKPDKGDKNATEAAKDGVANIVQNASDAIDMGNDEKAAQLMHVAKEGSQAVANMQMSTGEDAQGNAVIAIDRVQHPQLQNAGSPQPYYDPAPTGVDRPDYSQSEGDQVTDDLTRYPKKIATDVGTDVKQWVQTIWRDYKTPILFTAGGIVAFKLATGGKKKRR